MTDINLKLLIRVSLKTKRFVVRNVGLLFDQHVNIVRAAASLQVPCP